MISKSTTKLIKSLAIKKYRNKERLFLVEGEKNVQEVLRSGYQIKELFATQTFISQNKEEFNADTLVSEVEYGELKKVSLLKTPQNCVALCKIPSQTPELETTWVDLALYLDGIQDPGNLGTIIRICDWFGITTLFCSTDTVDVYNPKVIQATMGSFCRVNVSYYNLDQIATQTQEKQLPVYGAFLKGDDIYTADLPRKALVVVGNEGNGIRESAENYITNKLTIPSFALNNTGAESLNVAIATGIICSEFRRQGLK